MRNARRPKKCATLWTYVQDRLSRLMKDPSLIPEVRPQHFAAVGTIQRRGSIGTRRSRRFHSNCRLWSSPGWRGTALQSGSPRDGARRASLWRAPRVSFRTQSGGCAAFRQGQPLMSGRFASITADLLARKGTAMPSAIVAKPVLDWAAPVRAFAPSKAEPEPMMRIPSPRQRTSWPPRRRALLAQNPDRSFRS